MTTEDQARYVAAQSDREIRELAMKLAPGLREHCAEHNHGQVPTDEDIAVGMMIRATASAIVRFCNTTEQVCDVTRLMQHDLAVKVGDILAEGRPMGVLHS